MYKIERATALSQPPKTFGVFVDMRNLALIHAYERYVDATVEKNWEQMAIDWIVEGIDPDAGLSASSVDRAR